MNQFRNSFRWAWSILVVCTLAFAMGGCEGDDGSAGPAGATGATGPTGPAGPPGADGQDLTPTPVEDQVAMANVESCNICHEGNGPYHQMEYDQAFDSDYVLDITNVEGSGLAAPFTIEITFTINYMGSPLDVDPATSSLWPDGLLFRPSRWDDTDSKFAVAGSPFPSIGGTIANNGGGSYTLTKADATYDINTWDSGAVVGTLTNDEIFWPDAPTSHFHSYNDHSTDAFEFGGLSADYTSLANVEGCEACHGTPYRKHANVQASVTGAPDFTYCKSCHFDDYAGGHFEWQQELDDPFGWATGVAPDPAKYAYTANVMNVTHMSHGMHLPYPQSIANCVVCHDGSIAEVTDDSFFTPETCKSCHVQTGTDAWPAGVNTGPAGPYAQAHRPPPLDYLWAEAEVTAFHNAGMTSCTQCHGDAGIGASSFVDYHSGYDKTVYDATGTSYTAMAGIAIDGVTVAGDLITVDFSAADANINPTMAISFYGWDSKHHIIAAHERDANGVDCPHNFRPGCNIEWEPGSTKPFFTEEAGSVAGDWSVTFDMTGFQAYKTDPIPTLIADGVVKFIEVTILPELELADGTEVNIDAVSTTYDLTGIEVADYYQGAGSTVDIDKCGACHENTGVLVHTGSGRYGDSMQTCKVCHNPTFDGSHMEMQSRSIDAYVHAIHAFQPFDEADVYNFDPPATGPDPVDVAKNEAHKNHSFPYFTVLACEACHVAGTYDVPDQAMSMPGNQYAADSYDDPNHRMIGAIPESVSGAAGRACGSCHRAFMIKADAAGDLATFNAHTAAFGTFVENAPKDADGDGLDEEGVLYGIINKIMSQFQ